MHRFSDVSLDMTRLFQLPWALHLRNATCTWWKMRDTTVLLVIFVVLFHSERGISDSFGSEGWKINTKKRSKLDLNFS